MKIGERLKPAWCLILWEFMNVPWKTFHVLFSHASCILMFPIKKKKQNIPSFTKWVGFNSIICKYLYIFPKNTWAELHFFLITYMPQYIILAPTSCTCKTELSDENSVQDGKKKKISGLLREQSKGRAIQIRTNVIWSYFPLQFLRFVAVKELSDIRPRSYKHLCTHLTTYSVVRDKLSHCIQQNYCWAKSLQDWILGDLKLICNRVQNSQFIALGYIICLVIWLGFGFVLEIFFVCLGVFVRFCWCHCQCFVCLLVLGGVFFGVGWVFWYFLCHHRIEAELPFLICNTLMQIKNIAYHRKRKPKHSKTLWREAKAGVQNQKHCVCLMQVLHINSYLRWLLLAVLSNLNVRS